MLTTLLKRMNLLLLTMIAVAMATGLHASDWSQFRGVGGTAASPEAKIPLHWGDGQNVKWATVLPGPGASSPIVLGDSLFVTCYSGYGVPDADGGEIGSLERHLLKIDRKTGAILWKKTVPAEVKEDEYKGFIAEHGYATNTPVCDSERVYCFFGKTGVLAFDLDGKQLWKTSVGTSSGKRQWGSGSSLILSGDAVIVNASDESESIRALDKATGKEIWKAEGAMDLAYGTPILVPLKSGRTDLVLAVPGEIWGLSPKTGKLQWFAEHKLLGNICPSVVANGETLFVFGGIRSAGSVALRAGGEGDTSESAVIWSEKTSSYVATPVYHAGHLYWVDDRGQAYCVDATTGKLAYRQRVEGLDTGGRPVYASPVFANDRIYAVTRWGGTLVLPAKPEYEVLAQNRFVADGSDFNATPAIAGNEMFLRSNEMLYCISDLGE